ncbi:MAG: PH domain-containing protein [Capnocytophaga sp.]|nr:PH domain-containing protein [Capnocytophaga sp.]
MKKFNVSWGFSVKLITLIISPLLFFVVIKCLDIFINQNEHLTLYIAIFIIVTFVLCLVNAPISITINEQGILLTKIIGKIYIPYTNIADIQKCDATLNSLRLFGSGGLFGFIGIFYNRKVGRYTAFIGNHKQSFMIITKKNKKYVFSCEQRDKVIEIVNTHKEI